jgi:hypothetical protein
LRSKMRGLQAVGRRDHRPRRNYASAVSQSIAEIVHEV